MSSDKPSKMLTAAKFAGSGLIKAGKVSGKVGLSVAKPLAKITGKAAIETSKFGLEISKPIAKKAGKVAINSANATKEYAQDSLDKSILRRSDYSDTNFYGKGSLVLQDTTDAILNDPGASEKLVRGLSMKLGFAGGTAGVFGLASLIGTASTGTAIGSLSGAAFTNAALAWVGGSVATGGWILIGAGVLGAFLGHLAIRKVTGKKRKQSKLDEQERRVVQTGLLVATAFTKQVEHGLKLHPYAANELNSEFIESYIEEIDVCIAKVKDWEKIPLDRLKSRRRDLQEMSTFLSFFSAGRNSENSSRSNQSLKATSTGIFSAVLLKLLAEDLPKFTENEELVLAALRRSNKALSDATNEELAAYVREMTPNQILGIKNNVKGIYHELAYQARENSDGDEYVVELFESTNHPGADVKLINTETGEITELQLKATNYAAYVREHNERYEDISILVTEEVAATSEDIMSSELSNNQLTEDTHRIFDELGENASVLESMGLAAMINLATNAGVALRGEKLSVQEKSAIIEGGLVSATVAGLVQLVI